MSEQKFFDFFRNVCDLGIIKLDRDVIIELIDENTANKLHLLPRVVVKTEDGTNPTEFKNSPLYSLLEPKRKRMEALVKGMDASGLDEVLTDIDELQNWAYNSIEAKLDPPSNIDIFEFLLLCLRVTVARDMWFECKEQTIDQGPLISLNFMFFTLQMYFRLWRRQKLILEKPPDDDMAPPVWCVGRDFVTGKWFQVLNQAKELDTPVVEWNPESVYKALNQLMRDRIVGAVDITTYGARNVFIEYRNALLDRIAMFVVMVTSGTPDQLTETKTDWFVLATSFKDRSIIDDSGYKSVSKRVRETIDKETQRIIKEQFLEVKFDQEAAFESRDDLLKRIERQYGEGEAEKLISYLDHLKQKMRFMQEDSKQDRTAAQLLMDMEEKGTWEETGNEEDKEEYMALERDIKDLEELILKVQTSLNERNDDEREQRIQMFSDIMAHKKTQEDGTISFSAATEVYIRENMYQADHILGWQFPEPCTHRIFEKGLQQKCALMFKAICRVAIRGGNKLCLDGQKWIIARSLTLAEREAYRGNYSADSVFNSSDICASQRHTDDVRLKNFPHEVSDLLSDQTNPFHSDFKGFVVWWYLQQVLPKVNIDATIFHWNAEEEFLALDRKPIKHHCISRIGDRWILVEPGSIHNAKGSINASWFYTDIMPVLVFFLENLSKRLWKLHDRLDNLIIDVSRTALRETWEDITKV